MGYIVFDLDDTLLDQHGCVTAFTLQTLKRLQGQGHKLVFNTARSQYYSKKYWEEIGPDYAILNGGSLIIDHTGNTIFTKMIDVPTAQSVISRLKAVTDTFSVQAESGFYTTSTDYTAQNAIYFDFWKDAFTEPAYKIVARIADHDAAAAITREYPLECIFYLSGDWMRFTRLGTTKASGNRKLMELVGADVSDIIAFGDDSGDLDMLLEAGTGVLMKNAREELHSQCPTLSSYTNAEDGVARFLLKYFEIA